MPARKNAGAVAAVKNASRATNEKSQQLSASGKSEPNADVTVDAITLIKRDHRNVEKLFAKYASLQDAQEKSSTVRQICVELINHTEIEEEIFYPACREHGVDDDRLNEAQVEHDAAKVLIAELMDGQPDAAYFDAKVAVLREQIKHHVGEEEMPGSGVLAKARRAGIDLKELGRKIQARKQELAEESGHPDVPRAVSLHIALGSNRKENGNMASQYRRDDQGRFEGDYGRGSSRGGRNQERDERGRFESDDRGHSSRSRDDDDDRRYGRGNDRDRDEYGRFESDDRGGRSSHSRDDDDRRYARSGSGRERDEHGRFESEDDRRYGRGNDRSRDEYGRFESDDRGGRSSRSQDDDDRRYSRSSSSSRSRDEYGRFESDDRGSNRSSRSRDEDDRGGGGGRGWFGDSRGHSEAAHEGWQHRDDYGGSRARSGDYSRSSRSRDDDDDRGRDHRGWYGDSRGHSEAARRGWQNR